MTPKPRITKLYLCDNAFQDRQNKWNIIGIFTGDVLVEKFPARIRVTLYVEIEMYDSLSVNLDLYVGNKKLATVTAAVDSLNESEKGIGVLAVPGLGLNVDKPTEFRVVAAIGDHPKRTVYRKGIKQGVV